MLMLTPELVRAVAVGTAWKSASMAGYVSVALKAATDESEGSSLVEASSVLLKWQPRSAAPYYYWVYPDGTFSDGMRYWDDSNAGYAAIPAAATLSDIVGYMNAGAALAGGQPAGATPSCLVRADLPLSGELMRLMFSETWESGIESAYEAARTGSDNEW